ncbi:DUF3467 domain-containing protein [Planctomicrobium piriforme]|uniref:DUF3467 domain-containing protein n=1 Tax=Planctomicrobium piriforme TaxID=1576369 RepID=A0A1I3NB05_9PLAN|nr:DUF3467 domain-containing protein [Planctomicrobium piriforme]SFJ06090.1 Protein of unknown function [Planctomicrobium piriforme]
MSQFPGDPADPSHGSPDDDRTVHGQVRHHQLSARVPEDIGHGAFSNGVMILTGPFEVVLDFVLRLGEQQRVTSRVILPHVVGRQFVAALQDNIANYERRFGPMPGMPKPLPERPGDGSHGEQRSNEPRSPGVETSFAGAGVPYHPENQPSIPQQPQIEDIYQELKLPDAMLSGRYANAVLIRHSATEFCFDFITNVYPRSAVSSRVFLAAPHVVPFLKSLTRSLSPPEIPPQPTPSPEE